LVFGPGRRGTQGKREGHAKDGENSAFVENPVLAVGRVERGENAKLFGKEFKRHKRGGKTEYDLKYRLSFAFPDGSNGGTDRLIIHRIIKERVGGLNEKRKV